MGNEEFCFLLSLFRVPERADKVKLIVEEVKSGDWLEFHLRRAMTNMLIFDKNAIEFVSECLGALHENSLWDDLKDLLDILPHDLQYKFLLKMGGPLERLMWHRREPYEISDHPVRLCNFYVQSRFLCPSSEIRVICINELKPFLIDSRNSDLLIPSPKLKLSATRNRNQKKKPCQQPTLNRFHEYPLILLVPTISCAFGGTSMH